MLHPRAWLLAIAHHESGRLLAAGARPTIELVPGLAARDDVTLDAERRDELRNATARLAVLPLSQREAFVLREWLGLSVGEVALTLGTSVSAAHALIHRAREQLLATVPTGEAAGCERTRASLAAGTLDRAVRAHLVRCSSCRAARQELREQPGRSLGALFPAGLIATRLATRIDGFDAAVGAAAGGGVLAKLASSSAAVKLAALLAAGATAGGAGIVATREHAPQHAPERHTERAASPAPAQHASRRVDPGPARPTAATAAPRTVATSDHPATSRRATSRHDHPSSHARGGGALPVRSSGRRGPGGDGGNRGPGGGDTPSAVGDGGRRGGRSGQNGRSGPEDDTPTTASADDGSSSSGPGPGSSTSQRGSSGPGPGSDGRGSDGSDGSDGSGSSGDSGGGGSGSGHGS